LSLLTGGSFQNLCDQNFGPAFDAIANDITVQVSEPAAPLTAFWVF
jgi:hypothetical protein